MVGLSLALIAVAILGVHHHYTLARQPQQAVVASVTQSGAVDPPTRAELLALVNQERAKNGIAPLIEDSRLDTSAQYKAQDEINKHYFGHADPATGKTNGLDYLNQIYPRCLWVSENLTENVSKNDAQTAVQTWINSPPHHQAMIDPRYNLTGFGIANDQIVEHFCQTS